ncbi:sugar transferase [Aeromicrobium sp. 9AM]|uniref:sugar transferase n=1 Tax=Aeromicrobium sp. 9AM TaxID=2653126 RepID=UPI0012F33DC1|nr:sugar transferase [Aeromicrobium sp. 9AM]VXB52416.1 Polyprenyl glycosylphosphotransferase [Aeromicrobium sp. 9AM]
MNHAVRTMAVDFDVDFQAPLKLPATTRSSWASFYRRGLLVSDLVVLVIAVLLAELLRFGPSATVTADGPFSVSYEGLGAFIAAMWWGSLSMFQSRDLRILGEGADEYQRIVRATFIMFGTLAIASLLFKWDMSRGYLATAFPLGLALLLLNRKLWRVWLQRSRRIGRNISHVLVIGGIRSGIHVTGVFDRHRSSGLKVTGVWVPDRAGQPDEWLDVPERFVPVMGSDRTLAEALTIADADTVVVTDTEHLGPDGLRELTWELEGADVQLFVSPGVVDVAGSRIHMRAVASMPLLQLEEPQYAEAGTWPKTLFDRTVAGVLVVLFAPLMASAAIAVKLSSPGPVFFYQERIGLRGIPFRMMKFRSMRRGADAELAALLAAQGSGDKPLFKVVDDPRITRTGAFLRRFSIDELPQLFNVFKGDMSLVGPRPQQQAEVELYDDAAHRRLTVRPGMTGLWQVSGRSDLTWEESIRLDTSYVENWSMISDLTILWRTVRAVLGSDGAY